MANEEELYSRLEELQERMAPTRREAVGNPLARALSYLLADSFSVYHEAHGFHWNVKGPDFAQYHELFSDIYEDLFSSVDTIAEMILKLGYDAPFHLSRLVEMRTIAESEPEDTPSSMSMELLKSITQLTGELKAVFTVANDMNEQGIANFISERIDMCQKWQWQLRASLGLQKPNRF
jgi:starvation-inducible DNA-binding protein